MTTRQGSWSLVPAAALLLLTFSQATRAETTGTIDGVVLDATGRALRGALVGVWSASLQGSRVATSDRDGRFWLPALPPGAYVLKVTLPGFRQGEKSIAVSLDAKATIAVVLDPALEETVVVSGTAPRVDASSTASGTSYTTEVISSLPVARNYADIIQANPGVSIDYGDTQGRGLPLAIHGATSAENQWIIEGATTTGVFLGQQGKYINNEFVQEVEVKTEGYSAEYGRAMGGVINVITKSGGNAFHGDAFLYYDSDATVARVVHTDEDTARADFYNADSARYDYGLDLGGYVVKDRVWFFAAYNRVSSPSTLARFTETAYVSTADRFPQKSTDNFYSGKLTWNLASRTTLIATVFADPSDVSGATSDPVSRDPNTYESVSHYGGTDYALRGSQLLDAQTLITLQASHHRDKKTTSAADKIRYEDWQCHDQPPGTLDSPCELPPVPNSVTGGYGWIDGEASNNSSRRQEYRADLTGVSGNHEFKAGGDLQNASSDMVYACTGGQCVQIRNDFGQTYYQHTFAAISRNDLTQLPNGRFRARVQDAGAYLQDSWKPAPGLTVNLGLRWDAERLKNYAGTTVLSLNNEWQPRIGIVWDPWKDGRSKLYAFAGRYYYAFPTVATTWWFGNVTGVDTYNLDPVSVTPDPNITGPGGYQGQHVWFGGTPWGTPADKGLKGTYQDELSIGLERLIGRTLTVGLKGTYRRLGNVVEDRCDLDPTQNNDNGCAIVNPGSSERYARGDFYYCSELDDIDEVRNNNCTNDEHGWLLYGAGATPPARRYYRGIELLARKSIASTLWLQASYVYSSLIGNYDGELNERLGGIHPGSNVDFNWQDLWRNAYGRLRLDRPHHFRLDGSWVTPLRLSVGLQTWVESGAPMDKVTYSCCGGWPYLYLVQRGSAGRLPTTWGANLTLSYPFAIGPATVTVMAYAYNLFNNQIPTDRDPIWRDVPQEGYPSTRFDPNQAQAHDEYGKVWGRTDPRLFRAAVRVSF